MVNIKPGKVSNLKSSQILSLPPEMIGLTVDYNNFITYVYVQFTRLFSKFTSAQS